MLSVHNDTFDENICIYKMSGKRVKQRPEYFSSYYTLLPDCVHTLLHNFRVSYSPPRGF